MYGSFIEKRNEDFKVNDVINVLKNYFNTIKSTTTSPEIAVSNIRSFVQFLQSSSMQPILATIKMQKYNDLAGFQRAFAMF